MPDLSRRRWLATFAGYLVSWPALANWDLLDPNNPKRQPIALPSPPPPTRAAVADPSAPDLTSAKDGSASVALELPDIATAAQAFAVKLTSRMTDAQQVVLAMGGPERVAARLTALPPGELNLQFSLQLPRTTDVIAFVQTPQGWLRVQREVKIAQEGWPGRDR